MRPRLPIAPKISPNKTLEGFVGGVAGAVLIGTLLWWLTPFRPWQSAVLSLIIALMGFCGGLVMSAIKRDRGVKDYGRMIPGHGGIRDRIDSLCFAPVFFPSDPVPFHVKAAIWSNLGNFPPVESPQDQ
jgi:phosphatidate cytidylyltransferase